MATEADDVDVPWKPPSLAPMTGISTAATKLPRPITEAASSPGSLTMSLLTPPSHEAPQAFGSCQPAAEPEVRSENGSIEARDLVVGQGTSLSGEINSCDRLMLEGTVQANLWSCQHMTIAESGFFDGNAAIEDAEVRGRFEGDLVVHNRLLIRCTGRVSGTITYGQIEVEPGGRISGALQALQRNSQLS